MSEKGNFSAFARAGRHLLWCSLAAAPFAASVLLEVRADAALGVPPAPSAPAASFSASTSHALSPVRIAFLQASAAAAVERALALEAASISSPAPVPHLRSATLEGNRLTLDFGPELTALEPGTLAFEQALRPLHRAAAEILRENFASFEIYTCIDGVPLDRLFSRLEAAGISVAASPMNGLPQAQGLSPTPPVSTPVPFEVDPTIRPTNPPTQPPPVLPSVPAAPTLASRRIAVSPGHGYYLNPSNAWVLQRGYWQGIVEDFVNHDLISLVNDELVAASATTFPTRNLNRTAGNGESGHPKWQEAARYNIKALGYPATLWNESGLSHYDQDIRCRPRYANAIDADILVSLHNNGAGTPGAGTGTETLYDTSNGFGPESKRLADAVHARVLGAIRRDYNAAWTDRRVQGFNGSYGENRIATRPSILIELAFMDRPSPDNAALQDDAFKRLVARAIREGIEDYYNGQPAAVPAAPTSLSARGGPAAVGLSWTDVSTSESGFRVERRLAAVSGVPGTWEPLVTLAPNATAFTDYAVAPGTAYHYRVFAFNAVGSSAQSSNEVAATPVAPQSTARLANVSLRTVLEAGRSVSLGFVMAGGPRDLLVRVSGPALAGFGVASAMENPRLELYRGLEKIAENDDWSAALGSTMAAFGAFPFARVSRDAALQQAIDGAHTVLAAGTGAGAVLIEAYDAGVEGAGRIVNLSARQKVGSGSEVLIAGFHIAGTGTKRLLVRAVGPGLANFGVEGVLADPRLEVFDASGARLASDDDWNGALASVFRQAGAFALASGSRDAALVLALEAGRGYTVQVSGVGGLTGEALVEVYEVP